MLKIDILIFELEAKRREDRRELLTVIFSYRFYHQLLNEGIWDNCLGGQVGKFFHGYRCTLANMSDAADFRIVKR